MRLAYFTDVHSRFERVSEVARKLGEIDAIVIGGDLTNGGSPAEAVRAIAGWSSLAARLFAVAGNWDSAAIDAVLAELGVALDGRGIALAEIGLCGVSASPISAINAPYELEEAEIGRRLDAGFAAIESCRVRIVCSHTPPVDTACDRIYSGAYIGSSAVRAFVEERQPELVLCGHVHEGRGFDAIGRTRIANPGPIRDGYYAVVEIEDGEIKVSLDSI
jgi:Icc-related predicted phosphoesterase